MLGSQNSVTPKNAPSPPSEPKTSGKLSGHKSQAFDKKDNPSWSANSPHGILDFGSPMLLESQNFADLNNRHGFGVRPEEDFHKKGKFSRFADQAANFNSSKSGSKASGFD